MPPVTRAFKRRAHSVDSRPRKLSTNVKTFNPFSLLDNEKPNKKGAKSAAENTEKRVVKPAPITVTDKKCNVSKFLEKSEIKYRFKILGIGTKIFCDSESDRSAILQILNINQVEYFSHPGGEQKAFKVVLSGLPEIEPDLILNSLKERNNVKPMSISQLNGEGPNKLYLLQFNREEISRADLNNVKIVFHHIVKWLPFKPRKRGPTQCFNCGMYGHGATYCNRKIACLLCGEAHLSNTCPLEALTDADSHVVFKCINCASNGLPANHRATDDACPAKHDYIAIRGRANTRPSKNSVPRKEEIPRNAQQNNPNTNVGSLVSTNVSFAEMLKQGSSTFSRRTVPENVNVTGRQDLWSFTEVSELLLQSIDELSKCQTKLDQLRVIANLLQHACK